MVKRSLSGIFLLLYMCAVLFQGGILLCVTIMLLSSLIFRELTIALKKKFIFFDLFYLLIGIALIANFEKIMINFHLFILLLLLSMMIFMVIDHQRYDYSYISVSLFIFLYSFSFLPHLLFIRNRAGGVYLVGLALVGAWISDTFAYLCGMCFGKRLLVPRLSPKKTVAGFVGGLLFTSLAAYLYGKILFVQMNIYLSPYIYISFGAFASLFAQLGDLCASVLKRQAKIKDFGKIIPGHGGILDRFDSLLFTSVFSYYFIQLFFN